LNYFNKVKSLLDATTKKQFLQLMVFSIFISLIEAIGISAIMPFIDIATNFAHIHTNNYYKTIYEFFSFTSDINFAISFGFVLVGFYILRGLLNLLYNYVSAHLGESIYAKITKKLFSTYLQMPYITYAKKNSSYLTKAIITEAGHLSRILQAMLLGISEIFIIIFIYTIMLIASPTITLVFTFIVAIKILFLSKVVFGQIKTQGSIRAKLQAKFYETLNKMFGNFKHIKLQNTKIINQTNKEFCTSVDGYAKANVFGIFLHSAPRLFLETSGFVLVVLLLVVLLFVNGSDIAYILPTLSLFVLALYRLLPSMNRIISSYNTIMYNHKAIDIISKELNTKTEKLKNKELKFKNKIELKNICFGYKNHKVLDGANLTIKKGDKIAFVGQSGCGKSTLVDLIIGLHQTKKGEILVDGIKLNAKNLQSHRAKIGYIPQQVYLFDASVSENVCFGRAVNKKRLIKALKQANIYDFLQTKQGIHTMVGEGGVMLSGGQKQRIAIARALYSNPEILVLDEATSALDAKTEKAIMKEIYKISQDKTLLIIAHRLSTIKDCKRVYTIKNGKIIKA